MSTLLFAGGGSGGHLTPGLALAEAIKGRATAHFACSDRSIDATMLAEANVAFTPIPACPPSVRPGAALRFLRQWPTSRTRCRELLDQQRVSAVVALGGFVSAPAVSAARSAGIPTILLNLDAQPGRANRWAARRCSHVWTTVTTRGSLQRAPVVGMPIRTRAVAPGDAALCRSRLDLAADCPTLLVTGASHGARSLNEFVSAFARTRSDELRGWQVLHLCGSTTDPEPIADAYAASNVSARVIPFLADMGLAWGAADLAISRAGASSVAEVAANAVPTLFLPYPYHRDEHQRLNAEPLVERGGARMVRDEIAADANCRHAGRELSDLLADAGARARMRTALRDAPGRDAANQIADRLLEVVGAVQSTRDELQRTAG